MEDRIVLVKVGGEGGGGGGCSSNSPKPTQANPASQADTLQAVLAALLRIEALMQQWQTYGLPPSSRDM